MKHQQILDKLAARFLVKCMDENFARAVSRGMLAKGFTPEVEKRVWEKIENRWNCVLQAPKDEVTDNYKLKTLVAMAVLGHKYGLSIEKIKQKAFDAMDMLNKKVVLSDDFERKTPEIKKLLETLPVPSQKRPAMPENITFFRPEDVISIQHKGKFYTAYVHCDMGVNEAPVIEFYDAVFEQVPSLQLLENIPAKGRKYNDGTVRVEKFAVVQLKFLPDPANQVKLIASAIKTPPKNDHLKASVGLFALFDIFEIQQEMEKLFPEK